jgi:hypothetical protein
MTTVSCSFFGSTAGGGGNSGFGFCAVTTAGLGIGSGKTAGERSGKTKRSLLMGGDWPTGSCATVGGVGNLWASVATAVAAFELTFDLESAQQLVHAVLGSQVEQLL